MTDQEINIAIHEACGWIFERDNGGPYHNAGHHLISGGLKRGFKPDFQTWESTWLIFGLPDYCNDLNAMHEAEKLLTECADDNYAKFQNYLYHLETTVCNALGSDSGEEGWSGYIAFATARQRAEAFLKTIGKWKATEGKV